MRLCPAPLSPARGPARAVETKGWLGANGPATGPNDWWCDMSTLRCTMPRPVHVRLRTLTFHGYARLRTLTPQHSAHLCTLGLGDTEGDLLNSHAQVLCRKKIGAGGIFV